MKLGVHALMLNGLTLENAASLVNQIGYQGIEWGIHDERSNVPNRLTAVLRENHCIQTPTASFADQIHRVSKQQNLAIPNLFSLTRANDVASTQTALVFAQRVKSPCVRVNTGVWQHDYPHSFQAAKRFLTTVVALSRAYGVRCLVENVPNTLFASASQIANLVCDFDPKNIGVILDTGNLVIEGFEAYPKILPMLKPYLSLVHLKNVIYEREADYQWQTYWATLKKGVANIPAFLSALQEIEYDGWIIVEDLSPQASHLSLKSNYLYLQQLLAR